MPQHDASVQGNVMTTIITQDIAESMTNARNCSIRGVPSSWGRRPHSDVERLSCLGWLMELYVT